MKRIFFTTIILFLANYAVAQFRPNTEKEWYRTDFDEKKFSFGYFLGTNLMSYKVNPKSNSNQDPGVNKDGVIYLQQENSPGFSVGLIGRMRINDYIDLKTEPGVHFSTRNLYFKNVDEAVRSNVREVKSTYVEIPLLLKIHGDRWVNTRPYIQGGIGYLANLQSNENKEDDNNAEIFRTTTHNFNWQAELGIELYFKRFKLTPSLKGMFFINNELIPDTQTNEYSNTLNTLKTRAIVFSIKFE